MPQKWFKIESANHDKIWGATMPISLYFIQWKWDHLSLLHVKVEKKKMLALTHS